MTAGSDCSDQARLLPEDSQALPVSSSSIDLAAYWPGFRKLLHLDPVKRVFLQSGIFCVTAKPFFRSVVNKVVSFGTRLEKVSIGGPGCSFVVRSLV